jgi:DNA repair protein RecO (recombination protein O)
MPSRYEKTRGVVLSSRPLGEADRIVSLFSRELGRLDAVVKGVRRTKSRWGGRLEPFGVVDLVLFRGRTLYTITSAQLVAAFTRLREDREAMTAAALACEAVAGLFGEEERHERVFNLLTRALAEIDRGFDGPARSAPLVLGVLMKLLHEAGYLPVLDQCARCGSSGLALAFSASLGGLVCECSAGEGVPVGPEAVAAMRSSVELPLADLREQAGGLGAEEALRHVHQLYMYQTGARLRALRYAQVR